MPCVSEKPPERRAILPLAMLALLAVVVGRGSFARAEELRGRWVLDQRGHAVPPGSFRRGLQSSGLVARGGELWSIGDQRSEYPGHLFRIDPRTGRLLGEPLRLLLPEPAAGENPHFATYRSIPNSDFEGLAADPRDPSGLIAVTEDKVPWVASIRVERDSDARPWKAWIRHLARIRFPQDVQPWRYDSNFRLEGIAVSDDAKTLYLAFERAEDELPRLFQLSLEAASEDDEVRPSEMNVRFEDVPGRKDKDEARLNLNDIQFLRWRQRPLLLSVARDQERLLVIDITERRVLRWIDLDLRDPEGRSIYWVSPEGLALDEDTDRLWIINDPDSVRGNYRRRDEAVASGPYADFAPLLFETRLSPLLEGLIPPPRKPPKDG